MNNKRKKILINILVICLYFIWPYFLNSFTNLFNLPEIPYLSLSFGINFIFLFVIIYIYKDRLGRYYKSFKKGFKKNIINCLKIFLIGLLLFVVLNNILYEIGLADTNNANVMTSIFKKIPFMFVLNTLFYYPIIEELVFKMSLKDIIKSKWYFVIITGGLNAFFQIIFSIANPSDLIHLLPYTLFFSVLSYIYYKTDNIMYPILFRICYNLIPCIIYIKSFI